MKPAVAQHPYQVSSESFRRFSSESCGRMDRQTHMASPMCVHFMLIVQWAHNNDPRNLLTAKVTQCRYVTDLVGVWRHCWLPSLYEHCLAGLAHQPLQSLLLNLVFNKAGAMSTTNSTVYLTTYTPSVRCLHSRLYSSVLAFCCCSALCILCVINYNLIKSHGVNTSEYHYGPD